MTMYVVSLPKGRWTAPKGDYEMPLKGMRAPTTKQRIAFLERTIALLERYPDAFQGVISSDALLELYRQDLAKLKTKKRGAS
jgi:hypothetical protein